MLERLYSKEGFVKDKHLFNMREMFDKFAVEKPGLCGNLLLRQKKGLDLDKVLKNPFTGKEIDDFVHKYAETFK